LWNVCYMFCVLRLNKFIAVGATVEFKLWQRHFEFQIILRHSLVDVEFMGSCIHKLKAHVAVLNMWYVGVFLKVQ
jgi:hypothetical protein